MSGLYYRSALIVALAALLGACSGPLPETASTASTASTTSDPFRIPRLSVAADQAQSLDSAYRQQGLAVRKALAGRMPAGFKAGLTTRDSQRRFDVNEPIAGVLWPDAELPLQGDIARVPLAAFAKPMLEVELAFRINMLIPDPLADIAEVQHIVSHVMAAVELPDLGFDSAVGMTGPAVVAANAGASRYVLGPPMPIEQVDINAVNAVLSHNGERVQRAEAVQVLGNQWRSLYWLINKMVEQGWVIQPGQILLTGSMGPMLPLHAGVYVVNYGELGEFRLQVE